jgi:hypothetical protein
MKPLKATLVQFQGSGDGLRAHRALGPCTGRRARGFTADLIIFERQPRKSDPDWPVFLECLSNSVYRLTVVKEK